MYGYISIYTYGYIYIWIYIYIMLRYPIGCTPVWPSVDWYLDTHICSRLGEPYHGKIFAPRLFWMSLYFANLPVSSNQQSPTTTSFGTSRSSKASVTWCNMASFLPENHHGLVFSTPKAQKERHHGGLQQLGWIIIRSSQTFHRHPEIAHIIRGSTDEGHTRGKRIAAGLGKEKIFKLFGNKNYDG